jgi:hypothetical protein
VHLYALRMSRLTLPNEPGAAGDRIAQDSGARRLHSDVRPPIVASSRSPFLHPHDSACYGATPNE